MTTLPYLDSIMSRPFGIDGNATAVDQVSGALLFYTDGASVYDASHLPMPGAPGGASVSANQGVAISPVPGSTDQYYVFKINASGNTEFFIVDMSLSGNSTGGGNLGQVTSQGTVGGNGNNVADAIAIVEKTNVDNGYWLVTQEPNTTIYKVINISPGGISDGGVFDFFIDNAVPTTAAHFAVHPGGLMAVTPMVGDVNIQLVQIDRASGNMTYNGDILNSATTDVNAPEAIYDAAWSPNADVLFVSQHGGAIDPAGLLVYEIAVPTNSARQLFPSSIFRSYGLKYGADGLVYHLYQEANNGPYIVGRVDNPSAPIDSLVYTERIFGTTDFFSRQFPATLPAKNITINAPTLMTWRDAAIGNCVTDTVWFFPDFDPRTQSFIWDFGDTGFPGDAGAVSPGYHYQSPGTYNISLSTALPGGVQNAAPFQIDIGQTQLMIDLGQDTVICPGESLELMIDEMVFTQLSNVLWSTGDTDVQSIMVMEGGNYWVSGDDVSSGCNLYDAIQVDEYGVQTQISAIWYFGQNAGLDFNQIPPVPLDDSAMDAPAGCSAYSDLNGEILFYTDGRSVYTRDHVTMPNGTNLVGDPISAQSSLIVQFPSDETLYYIFTTRCTSQGIVCTTFQLDYSVVDLKVAPGGDVVIKNKPLFGQSTERVSAITFGNIIWLLAHEYGTNAFRAYPITPLGIGAPVISSVGSSHGTFDRLMGSGTMKFSSDGGKIAVALASSGMDVVELFDFNAGTGEVSNAIQLDLGSVSGAVYGVEFSPNSNWLYATVRGPTSEIYHWHVDSTTQAGTVTDPDYIINSRAPVPNGSIGSELGTIQLGPNGQMYVAIDNADRLGLINGPDGQQNGTSNADADLTNGQQLAGGTLSALGLPNFIQNQSSQQPTPTMTLGSTVCVDELITFSATATSVIDQFSWSIFNSSGGLVGASMLQQDTISFSTPDDYIFSVRIFNRCLDPIAILTDTITVAPLPLPTTGASAIPICDQAVTIQPYDSGPHPEYTYLWSNGATTQDITVSAIGNYMVTITDPITDCFIEYSVFVGPPFEVNLGPDQVICENQVITLDSRANADQYIWELIDIGTNTATPIPGFAASRFLPIDQISPPLVAGQTSRIAIGVIDPIDPTCTVRDTVDITFNALPTFLATVSSLAGCPPTNDQGEITIDIVPGADPGPWVYDIVGPSAVMNQPITNQEIFGMLMAGAYTVTVRNTVTGCSEVQNITIDQDPTLALSTEADYNCAPGTGTIGILVSNAGEFPVDYILTEQTTMVMTDQQLGVVGAGINMDSVFIAGLDSGTYTIEIIGSGGCSAFATDIDVSKLQIEVTAPLTLFGCDTDGPLDLTAGVSTIPSNPDINLIYNDGVGIIADPANYTTVGANQQITVIATDASNTFCDNFANLTVNYLSQPDPEIVEQGDPCTGTITLQAIDNNPANASLPLTFRWSNGAISPSITVSNNINGQTLTVTATHALYAGCFLESPGYLVGLPIPFTVQLTSEPPCANNDFVVTAATFRDDLTYKWFINGSEQPEITNQITREDIPGLYRAEATDPQGCTQSDDINIIINPTSPSLVEPLYTVCFAENPSLLVDPGPGFVQYAWYDIVDPDNPTLLATTPTFSTITDGQYLADLTNGFQCITSQAFDVLEDCEAKIFGPNAFRPGSSIEENRVFNLRTEFVDEFSIFIYNRWGEIMFTSDQKDFAWDGAYNGVLLPAGSYTYVVKYTKEFGDDQQTLSYYGGITLIR